MTWLGAALLLAAAINLAGSLFVVWGAKLNKKTTDLLREIIPQEEESPPSLYTALSVVQGDPDEPE